MKYTVQSKHVEYLADGSAVEPDAELDLNSDQESDNRLLIDANILVAESQAGPSLIPPQHTSDPEQTKEA